MVNLYTTTDEEALLIDATGRVTEADAPAWRAALEVALRTDRARIVLVASGLEYIGGAGLRALAQTARQAAREGRELRLAAPSEALMDYLTQVGLADMLPVYATREAAAHQAAR